MESRSSLKIAVVGAGLGGMAAAFRFAKQGHDVEVYERRPSASTQGGAIFIMGGATRCLERWGLKESFSLISDVISAHQFRNAYDNTLMMQMPAAQDWGSDRQSVVSLLHDRAVGAGARISFGSEVVSIEESESKATIQLNNGVTTTADLVICADGILSRLRSKVLNTSDYSPAPAPSTHYPVEIPYEALVNDENAKSWITSTDSIFCTRTGGYAMARYHSKLRRLQVMFSIQAADNENPRLWDEHGDLEYVREYFKECHPALTSVLQLAKSCCRWRLASMPELPQWSSEHGRLLLLGDAAHAMLPNAAQGFSSIIEDIEVLSTLLEGVKKPNFQGIAKSWQEIRMPRVTKMHALSQFNYDLGNKMSMIWSNAAGNGSSDAAKYTNEKEGESNSQYEGSTQGNTPYGSQHGGEKESAAMDDRADANADFGSPPFHKWLYEYDATEETRRYLKEAASKAAPKSMANLQLERALGSTFLSMSRDDGILAQ
ncbi:hypothetical protein CBER1_03420 [Cercospora berteroae]|uniref:FAD-binding domain-containing protein n=1 Tax=Cercospora berteroae TaxID=357750 RepID=A0A2S6C8E0_9PEZI|nr:hypothetical protein CBER1_03420 [Cercospora berteroae]